MKIPVLPISYGDALPLLKALIGPVAPEQWRGALPITYHVGPGPARVHLRLAFDWSLHTLYATTTREHAPVFTVEEARRLRGEIAGAHCKNLFLKDKNGTLWLIVCLEDSRVDLKALPAVIGSGRLSFASAELLRERLGVDPGSVTPFAAINAVPGSINMVLEKAMMGHDVLNYHPLENCATTSIAASDLVKFLRSCGHEPSVLALP